MAPGEPDLDALDSVFGFAGREWDNDVGLYYNRARWLDPKIGRFISEDPLGFEGGDSNLYRYANNNPFNLTDSTGLSWLSDLFDDVGDFFEGLFDTAKNFVTNIDEIVPELIEDPLFWGSLIVGPIFAANVTWGAFSFDVGLGLSGNFFAGPNYFDTGRNLLGAAGSAFTRSTDVGAFLPLPQSDIVPVQYLADSDDSLSIEDVGSELPTMSLAEGRYKSPFLEKVFQPYVQQDSLWGAFFGRLGFEVGDLVADEIPYAGQAKGATEALTGMNALGEDIGISGRIAGGLNTIPIVGGVSKRIFRAGDAAVTGVKKVFGALFGAGRRVDNVPGRFGVDPATRAADEAAGILVNGRYIKNPTARNLSSLLTDSGKIGGKQMSGRFMYVVDDAGDVIIGTRARQRMPHPTLIGGANPQVRGAGIVDIRGGRIFSVNNASGHFQPGTGSLDAARDAFSNLPDNAFHRNFEGFVPFDR